MGLVITNSTVYESIANTLREASGSNDRYYPTDMAEAVSGLYEAGIAWFENELVHKRIELNDGYTCLMLFSKTNLTGYRFKKTFKPVGAMTRTFYDYKGTALPENMDFSGVTSLYEGGTGLRQLFTWSSRLLEIPDFGLPAIAMGDSYAQMARCVTIEKIRIEETLAPPTFVGTTSLVDLTFEGVIGKDLNVSPCTKLSHDSLMNIIECLKDWSTDTSGTVHTLNMGTDNIAKLTDEELSIIQNKGWIYK